MPNTAEPSTLLRASTRLFTLPISVKSFGDFSLGDSGTSRRAASFVSSPYDIFCEPCITWPSATVQSFAGTFHCAAAAPTSISRAAAAAWRTAL